MDTPRPPNFHPPAEPVPFTPDLAANLPASAEVIVVGAGMLGASAAYRLAQAGMRPLVIEANAPAFGASGRLAGMALAGLGGHFPRVTRLVQEAGGRSILDYTTRSLAILAELQDTLRGGIEWERVGSVDLAITDEEAAHIRRMATLQAAEGLDVRIVEGADLADLAPSLAAGAARSAKVTHGDGKVNPFRLVYRQLEAALPLGATVVTGVRVEELVVRSGRVAGVRTSHGDVAAPSVLLATNAWTPALVPWVRRAVTPIREHIIVTEPVPPLIGPGFETNQCNEYWRQMATGEVLIGGFAAADEGMGIGTYDTAVRPQVPPLLARLLVELHPSMASARVIRAWTGLLDFAALEIPLAGPLCGEDGTVVPGGFMACGLTGHGLPYAPILGLLLAELIATGEATTLPLAPFDPRRYAGRSPAATWLGPFQGIVPA
jgi:sarcosine oxidase subunit beta